MTRRLTSKKSYVGHDYDWQWYFWMAEQKHPTINDNWKMKDFPNLSMWFLNGTLI